jgi:signal transduction histidine kinase
MTLKKRLTLTLGLFSGVLLALFYYFFLQEFMRNAKRDFFDRIVLSSEHIKNSLIALMLEGKGKDFHHYLSQEVTEDIRVIRLLSENGTVIDSSNTHEIGQKFPVERMQDFRYLKDLDRGAFTFFVYLYNEMPCQRCHDDGKEIRGIISIDVSTSKYIEKTAYIKRKGIFYFVILLGISIPLLWLFFGYAIEKPLRDLLKAIETVKARDLRFRVVMDRRDEFGRLSKSLNDIISEFEKLKRDFENCHLAEMRRVQEMATLGELASALAHEVRNPLAGISGALQVFSEEFSESDPRQPIIKEILKEVEKLERSIKDLMIFAKTPEPVFKYVSGESVMERLIRCIDPQAKKNKVSLELNIPAPVGDLYVDAEQIHQALFNIAQASIQNMPDGGVLRIELKKIDNEFMISFADTGQGMPEDEVKFLFKPFRTKGEGYPGVGLAISRGIIERHGGRIEVESLAGKGTTFRVYLPLQGS